MESEQIPGLLKLSSMDGGSSLVRVTKQMETMTSLIVSVLGEVTQVKSAFGDLQHDFKRFWQHAEDQTSEIKAQLQFVKEEVSKTSLQISESRRTDLSPSASVIPQAWSDLADQTRSQVQEFSTVLVDMLKHLAQVSEKVVAEHKVSLAAIGSVQTTLRDTERKLKTELQSGVRVVQDQLCAWESKLEDGWKLVTEGVKSSILKNEVVMESIQHSVTTSVAPSASSVAQVLEVVESKLKSYAEDLLAWRLIGMRGRIQEDVGLVV
ncbi:hypothetical protein R1sor_024060 [Riccia sorocarpa]|uniref:Uncharacterized protein n=1 Tax=Riccia sorocarpa TaxID=122646 RepID=A0ABD3GRS2_9MARC